MSADDLVLRLGTVVVASLAGWSAGVLWLSVFRVRDATLRAVCWTLAALPPIVAAVGLPAGGFLGMRVLVPTDWFLFRAPAAAPAVLVAWGLVAALLLVRHARRDARTTACLDGLAAASSPPADVAESVRRCAAWTGTPAPRIVAAEADGTAFVTGGRAPVLFVPLELWRRLDAAGRRALVLHELAHVRRRDPTRLRATQVVVDVLWPALPLRWTAARMRDAWEAQADEEAVATGATRAALARSLVEAWAGPRPAGVRAFGGTARATAKRLDALRRRPRVIALALQISALLWFFPWWPLSRGPGVEIRFATERDGRRSGVVSVALGAGDNPLAGAVVSRSVERWRREIEEKHRARAVTSAEGVPTVPAKERRR